MGNHRCADPFRALMWQNDWRPQKVTLARVMNIEGGESYQTVPFVMEFESRGEHMRKLAVGRRARPRISR